MATSANASKYTKLSRGQQLQSWGLLVVLPTVGLRNIQNQFSPKWPTDVPYGHLDDSESSLRSTVLGLAVLRFGQGRSHRWAACAWSRQGVGDFFALLFAFRQR